MAGLKICLNHTLRLLLNDVPVFHDNLFGIRCGRIVGIVGDVVTNGKISFVYFVLLRRQYFLDER